MSGAVFLFPNGKPQKVQAQVDIQRRQSSGRGAPRSRKGMKVDPPSRTFQ